MLHFVRLRITSSQHSDRRPQSRKWRIKNVSLLFTSIQSKCLQRYFDLFPCLMASLHINNIIEKWKCLKWFLWWHDLPHKNDFKWSLCCLIHYIYCIKIHKYVLCVWCGIVKIRLFGYYLLGIRRTCWWFTWIACGIH